MAILANGEIKGRRTMWQILRKKTEMPTADRALPGRAAPSFNVPAQHFVNGNRIQPPFPAGLEMAMFGMGCFWGAERKFWEAPGIYTFSADQKEKAEASRAVFQRELAKNRMGAITTEIVNAPAFYYAEDYHQQYLAKNPGGYCGLGGTGVSCPIGLGVQAAE